MKLLLWIAVAAAGSALTSAAESEVDERFAYLNLEDNGIRLDFNSTSIAYGVVAVAVVALLLLVIIPLIASLGGGGGETGLSSYGTGSSYSADPYADPYSSYKRSLDAAMPIIQQLQTVWEKFQ